MNKRTKSPVCKRCACALSDANWESAYRARDYRICLPCNAERIRPRCKTPIQKVEPVGRTTPTKVRPVCRTCACKLTDRNWAASYRVRHDLICSPCERERRRAYREKSRQKIREAASHYREQNRETLREKARLYQELSGDPKASWRARNPGYMSAYAKANPDVYRAHQAKRRAQKIAATPPDADMAAIKAIYALAELMTKITGSKYHVDHVIPLAKGGLHHEDNLVVMRGDINQWKAARIIPEFVKFFTPYDLAA